MPAGRTLPRPFPQLATRRTLTAGIDAPVWTPRSSPPTPHARSELRPHEQMRPYAWRSTHIQDVSTDLS
jgi:hypothetical protein